MSLILYDIPVGDITHGARDVHGEWSRGDTSSFTANGIWRRLRNLETDWS